MIKLLKVKFKSLKITYTILKKYNAVILNILRNLLFLSPNVFVELTSGDFGDIFFVGVFNNDFSFLSSDGKVDGGLMSPFSVKFFSCN